MPFLEQVWFSPVCARLRWAGWLRRRYTVSTVEAGTFPTSPKSEKRRVVLFVDAERDDLQRMARIANGLASARVMAVFSSRPPARARSLDCFAWLRRDSARDVVGKAVAAAFSGMELAAQHAEAFANLARTEREMEQLHRIGVALSATRDADAVLDLILTKTREITGADAGSIYLVEEKKVDGSVDGQDERYLRFKLSQNDSVILPKAEFTLPLSEKSIAGFVAMHGRKLHLRDAYRVPASAPYRLDGRLDRQLGYRTRSMLTLPMKNAKGEVLGVLQLINCKRDPRMTLSKPEIVARNVQPFSARAEQIALSLASQAAVSYENSRLYQDIEALFEGFVQASVSAIEQRDPATYGHSHRVCDMTCGLAEVVDRVETGDYGGVHFTREQMKEIRYAALLHDFGKVAVREEILVKAKKLYPGQMSALQTRFDYARKELEVQYEKQKLDLVMQLGPEGAQKGIAELCREFRAKQEELDEAFRFILRANEPTVLPEGNFERLEEIGSRVFRDPRGAERPLLTPEEIRFLSIPKGSLDGTERQEIESHVVHSFNFLMRIPWTRDIRGIPAIARAHHEKLNGTGYPYRLKADQIPLQAKIMTVCDIFDALAASDRAYKRAVSPQRALDILEISVKDNELDPALFKLFVDAKIYQLLHKSH
jgi:HD-GYP domain-containing protein (c-di-GMP phosphodiesterase class II)